MNLSKEFGIRLKKYRLMLSLSQEELAYRCGMQPSHIGQLERGVKSPTLNTLNKISKGLNIALSELVNLDSQLHMPNDYDEPTNKILAAMQGLALDQKEQILQIVKTFPHK